MYDNRRAKIVDGRAYTDGDTELYTELPHKEQEIVLNWIRQNILPRKTPLLSNSSYGLKHMLERDTDIYMTNNQFKEAMLLSGFLPVEADEKNWRFYVLRSSPMFGTVTGNEMSRAYTNRERTRLFR